MRFWSDGGVDQGYAITRHKAQGLTTDRDFVLGTGDLYRELGYVALSRGRLGTDLYVAQLNRENTPTASSSTPSSASPTTWPPTTNKPSTSTASGPSPQRCRTSRGVQVGSSATPASRYCAAVWASWSWV